MLSKNAKYFHFCASGGLHQCSKIMKDITFLSLWQFWPNFINYTNLEISRVDVTIEPNRILSRIDPNWIRTELERKDFNPSKWRVVLFGFDLVRLNSVRFDLVLWWRKFIISTVCFYWFEIFHNFICLIWSET